MPGPTLVYIYIYGYELSFQGPGLIAGRGLYHSVPYYGAGPVPYYGTGLCLAMERSLYRVPWVWYGYGTALFAWLWYGTLPGYGTKLVP